MAEDWIRVRTFLSSRPVAKRLARLCRDDAQKAAGVLVDFWSGAAEFSKNGYIRDESDATLEEWAKWRGKRGAFATWVRAEHMDDEGRIPEWDDFMGALEARRQADRERKELERLRRKADRLSRGPSADSPRDSPQTSRGSSAPTRANVDVDVTKRDEISPATTPPPVAHAPPRRLRRTDGETAFLAALPEESRATWEAMIDGWLVGMGYARGRAAHADDVHTGLLEYLAVTSRPGIVRDFSPRYVVTFVEGAERRRLKAEVGRPARDRKGRQRAADDTEANALAAALAVQGIAKRAVS
ncbi:MAG TPA: hypothetical protein VF192_07150 [Longimicrobiales bacterium]